MTAVHAAYLRSYEKIACSLNERMQNLLAKGKKITVRGAVKTTTLHQIRAERGRLSLTYGKGDHPSEHCGRYGAALPLNDAFKLLDVIDQGSSRFTCRDDFGAPLVIDIS